MMLFLAIGKNGEMVSCQEQLKEEMHSICAREMGMLQHQYRVQGSCWTLEMSPLYPDHR